MPLTPQEFAQCQAKDLPLLLTTEDCTGKTFVVTGAYSGIGYEVAKHLLKLQAARVVIAVRDLKRGEAAKKTLETETGRENAVEVFQLDLGSYDSVRAFADRCKRDLERIDGLVANAAVGLATWSETEGFETSLVVNFVSNILLLALLVPYLQETSKTLGIKPVITFLGSSGVLLAPKPLLGDVDQKNILTDLNNRSKWEPALKDRYLATKLLLHLAVRHLSNILPVSEGGIILNVADPGLCATSWNRNFGIVLRLQAWVMNMLLGRTPEMGSRSVLAGLALGDESHGKFVSDSEIADAAKLPEWMSAKEGKEWETQAWEQVAKEIERIQPGSLRWVPGN